MEEKPLSRLALSVVIGVLQSLVSATPSNVGQTMLSRLYNLLHNTEDQDPQRKFYIRVTLNPEARHDLDWWKLALSLHVCHPVRPICADALRCTWGDGSGTGGGGTSEDIGSPSYRPQGDMEMWMGTWSYHIIHFSSNKKEMKTLVLTLEQEYEATVVQGLPSNVRDMTMFYFTDNTTVYYCVSSGSSKSPVLHQMVRRIKYLELLLGCHLEVIHVPGTTMIRQGTDGLSRGVWISPLHYIERSDVLLPELLGAARLTPQSWSWLHCLYDLPLEPEAWTQIAWDQVWCASALLQKATVWCPPPEMASQAISFILNAYVEQPLDTQAVLIIPRILQRTWSRLSRYIVECGILKPKNVPSEHSFHRLPVCVLYLPPHVRTLSLPPQVGLSYRFPRRTRICQRTSRISAQDVGAPSPNGPLRFSRADTRVPVSLLALRPWIPEPVGTPATQPTTATVSVPELLFAPAFAMKKA
jgi:hypothetical protein